MDAQRSKEILEGIKNEQIREAAPTGFPALPPIPASRYTDENFFNLEMTHLWKKSWVYAAHTDELPEKGSYLLWEQLGSPILIIRGQDGEIRAFYNTCRHRGAPIVKDTSGRKKLFVCSYHGWSYDDAGHLVAMRDPRDFVDFDKSCHGLIPVRCESFGKFIFVNFDENAEPLDSFMSIIKKDMAMFQTEEMSLVHKSEFEVDCNVKVLLDAFQETYHLKSIHQNTVDRFLDHLGTYIELWPKGHSRMITPHRDPEWVDPGVKGLPEVESVPEIGRVNNFSYNIFPNIVCPPYPSGNSLIIFWPVSINKMKIEVIWVAPGEKEESMQQTWDMRIENFEKILEEDTQFAAEIQKSVESDGFKGTPLSYQERRIYYWHETLDRLIGPENLPEGTAVTPLLDKYVYDPYA